MTAAIPCHTPYWHLCAAWANCVCDDALDFTSHSASICKHLSVVLFYFDKVIMMVQETCLKSTCHHQSEPSTDGPKATGLISKLQLWRTVSSCDGSITMWNTTDIQAHIAHLCDVLWACSSDIFNTRYHSTANRLIYAEAAAAVSEATLLKVTLWQIIFQAHVD